MRRRRNRLVEGGVPASLALALVAYMAEAGRGNLNGAAAALVVVAVSFFFIFLVAAAPRARIEGGVLVVPPRYFPYLRRPLRFSRSQIKRYGIRWPGQSGRNDPRFPDDLHITVDTDAGPIVLHELPLAPHGDVVQWLKDCEAPEEPQAGQDA